MPNVCGATNEYTKALVANWCEDRRGSEATSSTAARFEGTSEAAATLVAPPCGGCGRARPAPALHALPSHLLLPHGPAAAATGGGGAATASPAAAPKKASSARVRKLKQDAISRTPKVGEASDEVRHAARLEAAERARVGGAGRAAADAPPSSAQPSHARNADFTKSLSRSILTG